MTATPRQIAVLRAIAAFEGLRGFPPTQADIARSVGVTQQRAKQHIDRMASNGLLSHEDGTARGIRILQAGLVVLQDCTGQ